jgi:hypothetical protein
LLLILLKKCDTIRLGGGYVDVFTEQLVTRKSDARDRALKICIIFGTAAFCIFFLGVAIIFVRLAIAPLAFAAIPGIIWLGIHFFKGLSREYEYILTNKELDIDKIMGKRRRRRMVTLDLNSAENLQKCTDETTYEADATVSAHDNTFVNMWSLTIRHESHGKVVLLFNPNEAFLDKLNKCLPPRARNRSILSNHS